MLSLEYLSEEARSNGLPQAKTRAILREYLQAIILHSIYKHNLGKLMFFTGGTALRFFYNLPRFSEDLDFDTIDLSLSGFKDILQSVEKGLHNEGFVTQVSLEKRNNLLIAELYFKDLMKLYGATDARGVDVMIKIEVYKPRWHLESEPGVLSLYGYNFSAVLLGKANMLSEKVCALLQRKRGRDIYDTLFMLKKQFPFAPEVFSANKIEGSPKDLIFEYLSRLPEKELKTLANQVQPFLFKEEDIELVLKAGLYAERFLEVYR